MFEGNGFAYNGRAEIEEFYAYRRDRGPRVVLHAVVNFSCTFESDTRANAAWVCMLYGHDGEAPQPTAPPINISLVRDEYVLERGEWLVKRRSWSTLFEGGVPVTKLSREAMEKRRADADDNVMSGAGEPPVVDSHVHIFTQDMPLAPECLDAAELQLHRRRAARDARRARRSLRRRCRHQSLRLLQRLHDREAAAVSAAARHRQRAADDRASPN